MKEDPIYWPEEVEMLRSIIRQTGLEETIKWGAEVYTYNGKNVVSAGGFKNFFTLWFYNGVFLNDPYNVLVSGTEGKTKALRQWRFTSMDDIDEKKILSYLHEAIANEKEGRVWKPEKSGPLIVYPLLKEALDNDLSMKKAFDALTPYKQKEYSEYIESAKREATKQSRLLKIKPMILGGKGLHDQYK